MVYGAFCNVAVQRSSVLVLPLAQYLPIVVRNEFIQFTDQMPAVALIVEICLYITQEFLALGAEEVFVQLLVYGSCSQSFYQFLVIEFSKTAFSVHGLFDECDGIFVVKVNLCVLVG